MSEKKNVLSSLGEFMRDIFDTDNDGNVSFKELFSAFPNLAIPIAIVFVDVLVLVAEYRVWDFGLYVTGDPIKAFGFVLVSAVPFLLGQVFWLYPRANIFQKMIAIGFVLSSLFTSAMFGLADLTLSYNQTEIFQYLVYLTVGYIGATLIFIVIDPTIKANRMKSKAKDAAKFQGEIQKIANSILLDLSNTLNTKKEMEKEFGEDEVTQALMQLNGKKKVKQEQKPQFQPRPVPMASETVQPVDSEKDRPQ